MPLSLDPHLFDQPKDRKMSAFQCSEMEESVAQNIPNTPHAEKRVDAEGNKCINRYTVIADLGRGAYGNLRIFGCSKRWKRLT